MKGSDIMSLLDKNGLLLILQKIKTLLSKKVDTVQGVENYGKVFTVNSEGNADLASFPSQTDVVYDETKSRLVITEKTNLPGNVSVDPLLLNEGDAADAKVTGDRFNKLSEEIADKATVENGVVKVWKSATEDGGTDTLLYTIDLSSIGGGLDLNNLTLSVSQVGEYQRLSMSDGTTTKTVDIPITAITDEQVQTAVTEYLNANPVQAGATTEQANQIAQNTEDIAELKGDLADSNDKENADIYGGTYDIEMKNMEVATGRIYNSNGVYSENSNYSYAYLPVNNAKTVTYHKKEGSGSVSTVLMVDKDKNKIGTLGDWLGNGDYNIDVTNELAYIFICCTNSSVEFQSITIVSDGIYDRFLNAETELYINKKNTQTLIGSNNGITKFDLSQISLNDNAFANGKEEIWNGWCHAFINISGSSLIKIVSTENLHCCLLDADKKLIRNVVNNESGTFECNVYSKEYYAVISCKKKDINSVNIELHHDCLQTSINNSNRSVVNSVNNQHLIRGGISEYILSEIKNSNFLFSNTGESTSIGDACYLDITNAKSITIKCLGGGCSNVTAKLVDKDKKNVKNIINNFSSLDDGYEITISGSEIHDNVKYLAISSNTNTSHYIHLVIDNTSMIENVIETKKICDDIKDKPRLYDSAVAPIRTRNAKFIKGLHIDCGRKYFSVANLKRLIDNAYNSKLNAFQIYFSDNTGFRFALNDMSLTVYEDTIDLSEFLGSYKGEADASLYLTEDDMNEIISYAYSKNLEVIPAFDMPGHNPFWANDSKYSPGNDYGNKALLLILEKYVKYFASKSCRYFNICGDEVSQITQDAYADFMREAMSVIVSYNMTPFIYNDMICKSGVLSPYINNGAVVLAWNRTNENGAKFNLIEDSGYRIINANGSTLYWTLGWNNKTPEQVENTDVFLMQDNTKNYNIIGAIYHIWCDGHGTDADIDTDGTDVVNKTEGHISAFGRIINKAVPSDKLFTMTSPNGNVYRIDVSDDGVISATQI